MALNVARWSVRLAGKIRVNGGRLRAGLVVGTALTMLATPVLAETLTEAMAFA